MNYPANKHNQIEIMNLQKKSTRREIVFFYPHPQKVSGGLFYFYSIAHYLSFTKKYTIYVENHQDHPFTTAYAKEHSPSHVQYLNYENDFYDFKEDTLFFTYLNMLPLLVAKYRKLENRNIFIVDFNPGSELFLQYNLRVEDKIEMHDFYKILQSKQSLSFMDRSLHQTILNHSNVLFDEIYLPAFIEKTHNQYCNPQLVKDNEINVGIISRLDNDKIHTVINILDCLYKNSFNQKVNVHIVGDGNLRHLINKAHYNKKINLIFTSYLTGESLREYASANIDLIISGGVAALDMAALKLPVLIPTFEMKSFHCDKFYYIHNTQSNIIGCREFFYDSTSIETENLKVLIDDFYSNANNKKVYGQHSYEYVINNHLVDKTALAFEKFALSTKLTINDCLSFEPLNRTATEFSLLLPYVKNWNAYTRFRSKSEWGFGEAIDLAKQNMICPKPSNTRKINKIIKYACRPHPTILKREKYNIRLAALRMIPFGKQRRHLVNLFKLKYTKAKASEAMPIKYRISKILHNLHPVKENRHKASQLIKNKYRNSLLDKHYSKVLRNIKHSVENGHKIKVGFYIIELFQYQSLFEEMLASPLFEPTIVVVPDYARKTIALQTMETTYRTYSTQYGNVKKGYDEEKQQYLDFSGDFNMVFLCNPYEEMAHPYHHVKYLATKEVLLCFQNYGFFTLLFGRDHIANRDTTKMLWRYFVDSNENLDDLKKHNPILAKKAFLSGYCKMDTLSRYVKKEKKQGNPTILLCPHHTIDTKYVLHISNFLKYADFFLKLPLLYPNVNFIFRPHPFLFYNLTKIWTEEKISNYINTITAFENVTYECKKDFFESFANSDGIIHDCGSFVAEYLFVNKPSCYMLHSTNDIKSTFLPIGEKCLENYYLAFDESDIISFIDNVILKADDPLKEKRTRFSDKIRLNYPNVGKTIMKYIEKEILK